MNRLAILAARVTAVISVVVMLFPLAWGQLPGEQGLENLGMVGIKTPGGAYLQAHYPDGEMHASNLHRNEEETWFIVQIDKAGHVYGFYNWRNGKFISKPTLPADALPNIFGLSRAIQNINKECAPASVTTLGPSEKWKLVSGQPYGVLNAVAFKSLFDGTFLVANSPNHDNTLCGGEVWTSTTAPPQNDSRWNGWWVLEQATTPSQGKDVWNTVGGALAGIANKISPADIIALLKLVAGGK